MPSEFFLGLKNLYASSVSRKRRIRLLFCRPFSNPACGLSAFGLFAFFLSAFFLSGFSFSKKNAIACPWRLGKACQAPLSLAFQLGPMMGCLCV
jgi:hypothetical protein